MMDTVRHVKTSVSFVLQVIDDYTQKVIDDPILRVSSTPKQVLIRKPGGYFAGIHCLTGSVKVTVSSPFYMTEVFSIVVEKDNRDHLIHTVRLKPSRNHPLCSSVSGMEGRAPYGSTIKLVPEYADSVMKLLSDCPQAGKNDMIQMFDQEQRDLSGRCFRITDKDSVNQEFFQIAMTMEDSCYRLSSPLSAAYKKAGSRIYPVYSTRADYNNTYFLPVKELSHRQEEKLRYRYYWNEEEGACVLEPGRLVRKDFLPAGERKL